MLTLSDVKSINARVEKALKAEFGDDFKIVFGNVKYAEDYMRYTKLEIKLNKSPEENNADDQKEWNRACFLMNLKPEHFNQVIDYNGTKFRLVQLNPRKPKFGVVGERLTDGKKFNLVAKSVAILVK